MSFSHSARSLPGSPKKNIYKKPVVQTNTLSKTIQNINKTDKKTKKESVSYLKMTEDIATMLTIKDQIEKVLSLTFKVIKDNDATPQVLKILEPVVNPVKRSHPIFHKLGTQYFITFATMQESAKTNQVLSSASVRLARESFVKDWDHFCLTIDNLTKAHPPPHSKEISAKFQSIRSSLNYIKMTNENRKNPALHLTKYINNVQSLCDNLYEQIMNLFSAPSFPNFETDLLSTYITNVKSFLGIINNAFSNEFLQSGVMFFDLARVKSNIFTDCNEIVQSLKSAFAFPVQMGNIQKMKDEANVNIRNIVEKLSIPFAVVKPSEKSVARQELQNERTKELRKMDEEIEENADEENSPQAVFDQYSEAVKKVRNFLNTFSEIINTKPIVSDDIWSDMDESLISLKKFKDISDDQKNKIKNLGIEIKNLNETDKEREILYTSRKEMFINHTDEQNNRYLKLEHEFKILTKKCCDLLKIIDEKDSQIDYLKSCGDPLFLKKSLVEIGCAFANNNSLVQLATNNDYELVSRVKDIQTKYFNKKCESCTEYEKIFDEMVSKMKENIETNETQPKLIFNEFNESFKSIKSQNIEFNSIFDENKKILSKIIDSISKTISKEDKDKDKDKDVQQLFKILENKSNELIELKNNIENSSKKKEENYLKTIRQISSKLSKLLNDNRDETLVQITDDLSPSSFSDVRSQLVDAISSQLRSLRDKMKEMMTKEDELNAEIANMKNQRNDTTKRLSQLIKYTSSKKGIDDEKSFFNVIEATETKERKLEETIEDLQNRMKKLKNEVSAINTRLNGVSRQQIEPQKEDADENVIIESIYKNIEIIQDQKESLIKSTNKVEDKDPIFQNCLCSLLVLNDPKINVNDFVKDDKKLIEAATKIVEDFLELKKKIKTDFLPVSQVDQLFKPALSSMKDAPLKENHQVCLSFISKTLLSYLQTFALIDKYAADVNLAFRSYNGTFASLSPSNEGFGSFKELVHGLKPALDKIAAQICSASLLTILYKFISIIVKCIDLIQLNDTLELSSTEYQ
ncbi:hypothetical protein M9Y10_034846 [Tritrichomonas musculus]|uniref:Viral A-type inclusion protein n=1 Tax=Tritrichomonas musculus TaxID=1915356 RepID=A0ABR2KI34_9EUKA